MRSPALSRFAPAARHALLGFVAHPWADLKAIMGAHALGLGLMFPCVFGMGFVALVAELLVAGLRASGVAWLARSVELGGLMIPFVCLALAVAVLEFAIAGAAARGRRWGRPFAFFDVVEAGPSALFGASVRAVLLAPLVVMTAPLVVPPVLLAMLWWLSGLLQGARQVGTLEALRAAALLLYRDPLGAVAVAAAAGAGVLVVGPLGASLRGAWLIEVLAPEPVVVEPLRVAA